MSGFANNIEGNTVKGLLKEIYGKYDGIFQDTETEVYLTTDRYFEKYVLLTNAGVYEIWAGGYRLKDDIDLSTFVREDRFDAMAGLTIVRAESKPEQLLTLRFSDGSYFEIGLCATFNSYNHPERYMKFCKK